MINQDNESIPNVRIVLKPVHYVEITDREGKFSFTEILPGRYQVMIDHPGYQIKTINNLTVSGNKITVLDSIILKYRNYEVEGMVVTATRGQRSISDLPQQLNLISDINIKKRNSKTSAEVLREEPGIFVQKTNHGGGSAIIRGLSSNQLLLLVDGIRLNNSIYRLGNHQYLTTVDNYALNQIEVVRGPTSVLYGSDALGGTINLMTKRPEGVSSDLKFGYNILSRYASADEERMLHSDVILKDSRFAFLAGFSMKNYGDLRRGRNGSHSELEKSTNGIVQSPSGFKSRDFTAKLVYEISSQQTAILSYQLSKQKDVPRYDKYENNGYHSWLFQPQNRNLIYLIYENEMQSKFLKSLRASISYHRQKEGRETQKKPGSILIKEMDDVGTTGFSLQANSAFHKHYLTMGIDFYGDAVESRRLLMDPTTGKTEKDLRGKYADDATYYSSGVFLQDEIHWNDKWLSIAGLRFSSFRTNFELPEDTATEIDLGSISQKYQSLTGSLGIKFKPTRGFTLNTNIGQAFRAPNLSDLSKLGESKGDVFEIPNTDLEPEKMISYDFGIMLNSSAFLLKASFYYSWIWDLLASADASLSGASILQMNGQVYKIKSKKNIGSAYIRGLETTFNYYINRSLLSYGNLTLTFGQNTTVNEPVGGIPPLFGLVGLKWVKNRYDLNLFLRFAAKQDRLSGDDLDDPRIPQGGTPAWEILTFRSGFNFWQFARLQFAVENIFDYNYREHGSGINGPGRNYIFNLELSK